MEHHAGAERLSWMEDIDRGSFGRRESCQFAAPRGVGPSRGRMRLAQAPAIDLGPGDRLAVRVVHRESDRRSPCHAKCQISNRLAWLATEFQLPCSIGVRSARIRRRVRIRRRQRPDFEAPPTRRHDQSEAAVRFGLGCEAEVASDPAWLGPRSIHQLGAADPGTGLTIDDVASDNQSGGKREIAIELKARSAAKGPAFWKSALEDLVRRPFFS
jgi:hypothetical protein